MILTKLLIQIVSKIRNKNSNYKNIINQNSHIKVNTILSSFLTILIFSFFSISPTVSQTCNNLTPSFSDNLSQKGCTNPDTITFANSSTGTASTTATYYWKINQVCFDTTTGLSTPMSFIVKSGSYSVTVIAVTSGCTDSFSKTITISTPISVKYSVSVDTICLGSTVLFTNTTTNLKSTYTYKWDFNNNKNSSNSDTVLVKYNSTGSFKSTLTIYSGQCSYSSSQSITVLKGGQPIRFYNNIGVPLSTVTWKRCITLVTEPDTFTLTFASPDTLNNYTIYFGDGTQQSGSKLLPYPSGLIKHLYKNTGVYNVIVISKDANSCERTFYGSVINLRYPVVGIGGPDNGYSNGCISFNTGFKNTSSHVSSCTEFTWDFGDGYTSKYSYKNAGDSVSHTYTKSNCNIYVTLTATNSCGTTKTTWGPVNAYTKDIAKIGASSTKLCYPNTTLTIQNLSQYNCYSGTKFFFFDFGDGSNSGWTSIGAARSHTYSKPGKYTVIFKDSNLCGVDTAKLEVEVYGTMSAGFKYTPGQVGCKAYTVNFTDTSKGDSLKYLWSFGDKATSTTKNPTHTFTDTGVYTVTLTITGICGSLSTSHTINVYQKPKADFAQISNSCVPSTVTFSNKSKDLSPYAKFYWELGDGKTSALKNPDSKEYTKSGTYNILLIVKDTCGSDTFARQFTVFENPKADFTADSVCLGSATNFINTSSIKAGNGKITSYFWKFGDNTTSSDQNPSHNYTSMGYFQVELEVTTDNGCKNTISKKIRVKENPVVTFSVSPSTSVCLNETISFYGSVSNQSSKTDSFVWNFDDSTKAFVKDSKHIYKVSKTYHVTLTTVSENGCQASATKDISVYLAPVADFSSEPVCIGSVTSFKDISSTYQAGNVSQWFWDFNSDGNIDNNKQNPEYQYNTYGSYSVKLKVISEFGCIDSVSKSITVHPNPTTSVSSTQNSACQNTVVKFQNSSSSADSFIWNYNDGSSNESLNSKKDVEHSFNIHGTFYVQLTGLNKYGCYTTDSVKVIINPQPISLFTSPDYSGCVPFTASFKNESEYADSFEWYINNNLAGNAQTLSNQTFTSPNDSLQIALITKNRFNCKVDTLTKEYFTFNNPKTSFTSSQNSGCGPLTINFTNNSTNSLHFIWNFGDGDTSTVKSPSHTFKSSNFNDTFYIVSLKAYSAINCIDIKTDTIRVYPKPLSLFSVNQSKGCGPLSVNFTNKSNPKDTGSISIMSFNWNFGNGQNSTQINPSSQSYQASLFQDSVYNINLEGISEHGCRSEFNQTITVFPKPISGFTMDKTSGCNPLSISFKNTSHPVDSESTNSLTFRWNLGNGNFSTMENPSEKYSASNYQDTIYIITLQTYSEHNCYDSSSTQVTVFPDPVSVFQSSIQSGCGPLDVHFTNFSYPNDTGSISIMNFKWDFNNGVSSTLTNPKVTFNPSLYQDTNFRVTLLAYSEHGCVNTSQADIKVHPAPTVRFSTNANKGCGPLSVQFTNKSNPNDTGSLLKSMSFNWTLGNGNTFSTIDASTIYSQSSYQDTIYKVVLEGSSIYGCTAKDSINISVFPSPLVSFTQDVDSGCGPLTVKFTNNSNSKGSGALNSMSFIWNFGNGKSSTSIDNTVDFSSSHYGDTNYVVKLAGYSKNGCKDSTTGKVVVFPIPVSSFSSDVNSGCGPLNVRFTNNSTPYKKSSQTSKSLNYYWDFGNGKTSNAFDSISTYKSSNTSDSIYKVILIATSSNNCSSKSSSTIRVYPKPFVKFYANTYSGCSPLGINFTNYSKPNDTGSITNMSFVWNMGNGETSNSIYASAKFKASLTKDSVYTVMLKGTTEHGCIDSSSRNITVYPNPTISFTPSNDKGCGPLNVKFTNNSKPNDTGSIYIMNFFWRFGNGQSSSLTNNSVTFFKSKYADTTYNVSLIGYSEHNCIDSLSKTITVYPTPLINFNADNTAGCGPLGVKFTNNSSQGNNNSINSMSFNWNFKNGSTSNTIDANSSFNSSKYRDTIYYVKLIGYSKNNCLDSFSKNIRVYPNPIAKFKMDKSTGCGPLTVNFTNQSKPNDTGSIYIMNFSWDFGNGQKSTKRDNTVTFIASKTQDTTYQIVLTAFSEHGCVGFDTSYVTVYPDPIASFIPDVKKGCSPLTVNFTNNSVANNGKSISTMSFDWQFGNGNASSVTNPSETFINNKTQAIDYKILLSAYSEKGCKSTFSENITVNPSPEVSFFIPDSTACESLNIKFVNTTVPHDYNGFSLMKFNWDFNNGITTTAKDTSIIFTNTGSGIKVFNTKLIGTNSFGCTDTFINEISIMANPETDFSYVNPKSCGTNVKFTNKSISNDNGQASKMTYIWNFGNQRISYDYEDSLSFIQSYTKDTFYKVVLTSINSYGCTDTFSQTLKIYPKPNLKFNLSANQTCSGVDVYFYNSSTNTKKGSVSWTFGDGFTSTKENPVHAFNNNNPQAKLYRIYLYAESERGCPGDTAFQNILIHPAQSADMISSIDSGCAPLTINFYNNSHNSTNFHWLVSDSLVSTGTNLTYVFQGSTFSDSTYQIKLISENNVGCIDTAIAFIRAFQKAVASFDFTQTSLCSPTTVSFQNQTTGASDYFWNFGNGQTSIDKNPSTNFTNYFLTDIDFDVTLFSISKHNCYSSMKKKLSVHPTPLASFNADKLQGCDPVIVNFTNQSILTDSFYWDFGDGVTSSLQEPAHMFRAGTIDKIFTVTLKVVTKYGCSHTFSKQINVYATPKALFNTHESGCAPVFVDFKDESTNSVFWSWNFGDGYTSSEQNPKHIYSKPGDYSVKLRVSNYLGCSDTFTMYRNIIVHEVPKAEFEADKYYSEYPDMTFTFTSKNDLGLLHNWTFGNDRVIKTSNTAQYTFKDTGVYTVVLTVSSPFCSDTTFKIIIIDPPYPKAGFSIDIDKGCMPLTVHFKDTSELTTAWLWYFGDGETSTEKNPVHTFKVPGKFSVTLIATNSKGSDAEYKLNLIEAYPKPSVYFAVSPAKVYLPKAKVELVNLTVSGVSYEWYIDGVFHDTTENSYKIFYEVGVHDVMLISKSKYGCIDTNTQQNIIQIDSAGEVWMPNAFTPNGDGWNDTFMPVGFGYDGKHYQLEVFDRWGKQIFITNDINEGWDGTLNGELCMEGVYVYRMTLKLANLENKNISGNVTLLR